MEHPTDWTNLKSSNIAAAKFSYDEGSDEFGTLTVRFHNGSVYDYSDFPGEMATDFFEAHSPGMFFAQNIRAQFTGVRFDPDAEVADDDV